MSKRFVFGPVASRRLGISLGVDLTPYKTCNLDCVYCECGKTTALTNERVSCYNVEDVINELKEAVAGLEKIDYITFSGSGEPTLFNKIGELIDRIKENFKDIKLAMLTNSTLFTDKYVFNALLKCDLVLPSVDSVTENGFKLINRPHKDINLKNVLSSLKEFARIYKGTLHVEVFIVPGINDTSEELIPLVSYLKELKPEKVQINSLDRPGTEPWVRPFTKEELKTNVLPYFSGLNVEVICRKISATNSIRYAKSD